MKHRRRVVAASLGIVASWALAAGAQRPQANLPLDPPRERGTSITPAYEGWYVNPDGSFSMLIGYYNRNTKEALDIPVGRTTGSSRAALIKASRRTLRSDASGGSSSSRCRRISARRR